MEWLPRLISCGRDTMLSETIFGIIAGAVVGGLVGPAFGHSRSKEKCRRKRRCFQTFSGRILSVQVKILDDVCRQLVSAGCLCQEQKNKVTHFPLQLNLL